MCALNVGSNGRSASFIGQIMNFQRSKSKPSQPAGTPKDWISGRKSKYRDHRARRSPESLGVVLREFKHQTDLIWHSKCAQVGN